MRILYGVCGEGMGHATRSRVVIDHLLARGHDILVAASDQALKVLSSRSTAGDAAAGSPPSVAAPGGRSFEDSSGDETNASLFGRYAASPVHGTLVVISIIGLGMRCVDGALDLRASIEENARRLPEMLRLNALAWERARAFAPDAVITDYDSFAWFFAGAHGLPLVSIDNAQILPRCVHPPEILGPYAGGMRALEAFTTMKAPDARHYIVTTFFYPPTRPGLAGATTLVPPVLRREVLDVLRSPPPESGRIVAYKTSSLDDAALLRPLALLPRHRFAVYGLREDGPVPENVERRSFSTTGFLRELAACRAVVSNGGMSALGEALVFGKPVYAVPVRGQHEQVMNASYLEALQYGATSDVFDPARIGAFIDNADHYTAIIRQTPQHDENRKLYATLDGLFGAASRAASRAAKTQIV